MLVVSFRSTSSRATEQLSAGPCALKPSPQRTLPLLIQSGYRCCEIEFETVRVLLLQDSCCIFQPLRVVFETQPSLPPSIVQHEKLKLELEHHRPARSKMNSELPSPAPPKSHDGPVWSQPLQVPSRSGNDAQETAILSSIHSMGPGSRIKRSRRIASQERDPADPTTVITAAANGTVLPIQNHAPTMSLLKPVFTPQFLSLDRGAIAPTLTRPTAPFAKSERKKAFLSAMYYSECFSRKIQPREADSAAFDIQNQYNKWWVDAKAPKETDSGNDDSDRTSVAGTKRRRLDAVLDSPVAGPSVSQEVVTLLKDRLVEHLQKTGGDTTTTDFQCCVEQLRLAYLSTKTNSNRNDLHKMHGTWLTLSKPSHSECLGCNENGELQYTLGRMSFDMLRPSHLKVSIRAVMNNVRVMDPKSKPRSFPYRLAKELERHRGGKHGRHVNNPIRHYE
jgi:hypothetical protein